MPKTAGGLKAVTVLLRGTKNHKSTDTFWYHLQWTEEYQWERLDAETLIRLAQTVVLHNATRYINLVAQRDNLSVRLGTYDIPRSYVTGTKRPWRSRRFIVQAHVKNGKMTIHLNKRSRVVNPKKPGKDAETLLKNMIELEVKAWFNIQ